MKIVVANLKMYLKTIKEVEKFQNEMEKYKDYFVVAPQNIYIENFTKKNFIVSAQNSSDEDGAHTGEISPYSLRDLNVKYTILGHAELKEKYPEERKYLVKKIQKAINNDLIAILCVGEKEKTDCFDEIDKQLKGILPNDKLIISYEPAWAIGGKELPQIDKIEKLASYIKSKGHKKVLYGGSINEKNIKELVKIKTIDGYLIGSCAYNTDKLKKIIEVVK